MPAFSIITPTISRPTLARALLSVARQCGPYDEHIVIGDGPQPEAQRMALEYRHTRYIQTPKTGGFGAVQRDAGIMQAPGDYLIFLDDDDVLVDGVLPVVREIVAATPGALFLFRARFYGYGAIPDGTVLWRDQEIRDGNVSTAQIVCPNKPNLPRWAAHGVLRYNADFTFLRDVAGQTQVLWQDEILQITRPMNWS